MSRELKMHLVRPNDEAVDEKSLTLCGIMTVNMTDDPEEITCKHCSGFYRTNIEWYSQVKNRAVEARGQTGEGDLYTRADVEAGLMRLGIGHGAIQAILNNTTIFRNVFMKEEGLPAADPWKEVSFTGSQRVPEFDIESGTVVHLPRGPMSIDDKFDSVELCVGTGCKVDRNLFGHFKVEKFDDWISYVYQESV